MTSTEIRQAKSKFRLRRTVITDHPLDTLTVAEMRRGLDRHATGDRVEICSEEAESNGYSLEHGGRLMSVSGRGERRFWIMTESDRSVTTELLPQDYSSNGAGIAHPFMTGKESSYDHTNTTTRKFAKPSAAHGSRCLLGIGRFQPRL